MITVKRISSEESFFFRESMGGRTVGMTSAGRLGERPIASLAEKDIAHPAVDCFNSDSYLSGTAKGIEDETILCLFTGQL